MNQTMLMRLITMVALTAISGHFATQQALALEEPLKPATNKYNASANASGDGAHLTLYGGAAAPTGKAAKSPSKAGGAAPPEYVYSLHLPCTDTGNDMAGGCRTVTAACPGADSGGILYEIARTSSATGVTEFGGTTCDPASVPGVVAPVITLAVVTEEFKKTPWATANISTEPKGDVTLVNLDTYYQVKWSAEGFEPGEVNNVTLLGQRVEIRPRVAGFRYKFGDGQEFGPTKDAGGPFPKGMIRHKYSDAGAYPALVATTFTGDFRVNGGPWVALPNTVTVEGPPTIVVAKTARAVLIK